MNETRVASRYAKSLIDLAKEQGVLDQVHDDMSLFVAINDENPQFARVLRNPVISHEKKKGILNTLLKGRVNKLTLAMFDIITRKNREEYLYFIAKEYKSQYRILKGIQTAEVVTAVPITEAQRETFVEMIKKVSGKSKVEMSESVNESILGGFLLRIGDRQIDQTVRAKLAQLKNKFKDNPFIAKY